MKMVEHIKVGGKIYSVAYDPKLEHRGRVGEIDYRLCEISISPDLGKQQETDVLIHEAIHGMLDFMGEDGANNEGTVTRIASGIMVLIKDNPELFQKILN